MPKSLVCKMMGAASCSALQQRILGVPVYSSCRAMWDSRLVTTSGSNVTAWPDAAAVRADATPLSGTPTLHATAGPGGGPVVDLTGGQVLDAGATPAIPVSASWTLYIYHRIPTLDGTANYVFAQHAAADAGRSVIGYNAGQADVIGALRASNVVNSGIGASTAWELATFGREFDAELVLGADGETESEVADPVAGLGLANTGNLIGGLALTGAYDNAAALNFHSDAYIAHLSVWDGYHTAAQRSKVRAAIRAGHGALGLVPGLPGLLHHYRTPTLAGWPDLVGGIDGVHTGSPSLASGGPLYAPTGVAYNGTSQCTAIGSQASLAFIHQTWTFSISLWLKPNLASTARVCGNATSTAHKGLWFLINTDGSASFLTVRGQAGVSATATAPASTFDASLQHVMLAGDGSSIYIIRNGVQVGTASVVATATGNATNVFGLGVLQAGVFPGGDVDIADVAISTADVRSLAADIYAEGAP